MFACAMYPGNDSFLENVKQEAIYNIKRLRNHPSLALWCGNNEVLTAWENWGGEKMKLKINLKKLQIQFLKHMKIYFMKFCLKHK